MTRGNFPEVELWEWALSELGTMLVVQYEKDGEEYVMMGGSTPAEMADFKYTISILYITLLHARRLEQLS